MRTSPLPVSPAPMIDLVGNYRTIDSIGSRSATWHGLMDSKTLMLKLVVHGDHQTSQSINIPLSIPLSFKKSHMKFSAKHLAIATALMLHN